MGINFSLPGYGIEAIWKSAYLAHLSTFSEDATLHQNKMYYPHATHSYILKLIVSFLGCKSTIMCLYITTCHV